MSSAASELSADKSYKNSKIYRAGAGAGKTTQLVNEVYEFYKTFVKENNRVPKIVLTTFTRKATQEIKERLMLKAELHKDYDFLDYVLSKNNLSISTIHGILQVFLKHHAHIIGLDPGFRIVDNSILNYEAKLILKNIFREEIRFMNLLDDFSFKQLVSLLMRHSENRLKTEEIKTFTKVDFDNAHSEVIKNLTDEISFVSEQILSSTQNELWRFFAQKILDIKDCLEKFDFVKTDEILKQIKKPAKNSKKPVLNLELDDRVAELLKNLRATDFELLSPDVTQRFLDCFEKFSDLSLKFHESYINLKKEKGILSLSDLEMMSLLLLKQSGYRFSSFSKSYDYWLIDEFQDTAPVQVELLMKIIDGQKFFVVGDPQQSIYFFRGARVRVFEDMQSQILRSGGKLFELKKNYRSSSEIMNFANYFFQSYAQKFEPMDIGGISNKDSHIRFGLFQNPEQQAESIAQYILNLSDKTELGKICILSRKNQDLKFIANYLKKKNIPYFLHSAQGFSNRREVLDLKFFIKFLMNPHDNTNLIGLLRSPWFATDELKLGALLRSCSEKSYWPFLLAKKEDIGFESVLKLKSYLDRSMLFGISVCVQDFILESSMLECALKLDPTGRYEANIWKFLTQLKKMDHQHDFNYLSFLEGEFGESSTEEGGEDSDAVSSLEPNQVQLMTVHMSKGLEFDYVIIPHIEKPPQVKHYMDYIFHEASGFWSLTLKNEDLASLTPLPMKKMLKEKIEEELQENHRLLYVALTRAKKSLFLTAGGKQESNSWWRSMQLSLDEGIHEFPEFSYEVQSSVTSEVSSAVNFKKFEDEVVFDFIQSVDSVQGSAPVRSVTQQLKWTGRGIDQVVPLMKSAYRGVQIHRIFEQLKYESKENVFSNLDSNEKQAIEWVLNLSEIPFRSILKNGYSEWGFVYKNVSGVVSGQIDLWGIVDNKLWILDYKTGSSQYVEKAFYQLESYATALRELYALPIELVVVFPFERKIFKTALQ